MKKWDASHVAERWKAQYCNRFGVWSIDVHRRTPEDLERMYGEILAAQGDAARIDAIIGNHSWTQFHCSECDQWCREGVEFDNWDGDYVVVCMDCLRDAVELRGATPRVFTPRGFEDFANFVDSHGSNVVVRESSEVGPEPHVWVFCQREAQGRAPHLTKQQALKLVQALTNFAYRNEEEEDGATTQAENAPTAS